MTVQQARDRVEAALVAAGWVPDERNEFWHDLQAFTVPGFVAEFTIDRSERVGRLYRAACPLFAISVCRPKGHRWPECMAEEAMRIAGEAR